jgi:hypothetical protein
MPLWVAVPFFYGLEGSLVQVVDRDVVITILWFRVDDNKTVSAHLDIYDVIPVRIRDTRDLSFMRCCQHAIDICDYGPSSVVRSPRVDGLVGLNNREPITQTIYYL